MSVYTNAASRAGVRNLTGTDDRELFMEKFGQMVIKPFQQKLADYDRLTYVRTIQSGKADVFPIIGRKRDAAEHDPGEIILGGKVEHNDITITLDKMLYDAAFIPEIDELMAEYDLAAPYAEQLAESLASVACKRRATMHLLASRVDEPPYTGGPVPGYAFAADMKTNPAKIEEAYFQAAQFFLENDVSGYPVESRLPHAQVLLLARYTGVEGGPVTTGSGDRSAGTIGNIAGIPTTGTNNIPNTNVTTGNAKYRGDFSTTVGHISSRMAVGVLNRRGLRTVMKEQEDRLGTLLIASKFEGVGILRPECSFELATAAR